tara:strand:+ start:1925 stop:2068 length:144 start_codon:yes stop_codon:yes gene_type:complete
MAKLQILLIIEKATKTGFAALRASIKETIYSFFDILLLAPQKYYLSV